MNSLRGSAAIAQLSDMVISLSRDLQDDKNLAKVSVLKNRFSGETGHVCTLHYNLETGLLKQSDHTEFKDEF